MAQRYDLLTTGRLREGFTPLEVIPELSALLRRDPAAARRLLERGRTVVKRGLAREDAVALGRSLQAIGLEVKVAPSDAPAATNRELEPEGLDEAAPVRSAPTAKPTPRPRPADVAESTSGRSRSGSRRAATPDRNADAAFDIRSDGTSDGIADNPADNLANGGNVAESRAAASGVPPSSPGRLPEQPRFRLPRGNGCPRGAFAATALGPFAGVLLGAALGLGLLRLLGGPALLAAPLLVWAGLLGGLRAGEALGGRCHGLGRLYLAMAPALAAATGLGATAVAAALHTFRASPTAGLFALVGGLALLPAPVLPALLVRLRLHGQWCEKCQRLYRSEVVLESATASPVKVLQKLLAHTLPDAEAVEADEDFPALEGQRAVRVEREWCPGCGDAVVTAWLLRRDGKGIFHSRFWGDLDAVRRAIRARGGVVLPARAPRPLSRPRLVGLLAGVVLVLAVPLALMAVSALQTPRDDAAAPAATPENAPAAEAPDPKAPIRLVQDGVLPYDTQTPVGRMLADYPYLAQRRWRSFTDGRGRTMVEFRGVLDPARAALAPLGAASGDLVLQFALDAEGRSFALSYVGLDLVAQGRHETRDLGALALERLYSGQDVLAGLNARPAE